MRFGTRYDYARTFLAAARIQIRREDNPAREQRRQAELVRMATRLPRKERKD